MASKEKIYTIPVNDAFHADVECPLCWLAARADQEMLEYYLGPSLMEPGVRSQTNEHGFCALHLRNLYNSQKNRLGLGLMMHTHLKEKAEPFNRSLLAVIPGEKKGLFAPRSKENYKDKLTELAEQIRLDIDDCVICERIQFTLDRYLDVIFWQFFNDERFRDTFQAKEGFCRPHLATLLEGAAKYLNQEEAAIFLSVLAEQQAAMNSQLIDDVEWFTLKFDYRNKEKPWGRSKDALGRAIKRLEGDVELG